MMEIFGSAGKSTYNAPLEQDQIDEIVRLKVEEGCSVRVIAERVGRSVATVGRYLTVNGIATRTVKSRKPPLSEIQFRDARLFKDAGMLSDKAAALIAADLEEVNGAYASPDYQYYVTHR